VETGIQVLPERRNRNARTFPAVAPADPTFHLIWADADLAADHQLALERVCAQTTYLGHSATPVRVGIETGPDRITPNLVPADGPAPVRLRVFGPGRTAYLKARFDAGLRPQPALWSGYGPPATAPAIGIIDGPFDPGLVVFRQVGGRTFGLESCGMIADAIRKALMSRHGAEPPEWLSGHRPDGPVSRVRRPAFVPLGFVGHEHADGHLLGVAVALPADFPRDSTDHLFALLARQGEPDDVAGPGLGYLRLRVENPALGRPVGELALELDERPARQRAFALRPEAWTGPAERWATVTPVVLPQFPRRGLTPEEVVVRACTDAGFPEPAEVSAGLDPYLAGVPHARLFHVRPRTDGRPPRPLTHATIRFEAPVRGPVVIGSGRYAGYGLCRPVISPEGDT
jgi:CRISPR-associated protein Csb2